MPSRSACHHHRLRRSLDLNRGAIFNDTVGVLPSKPLHMVSRRENAAERLTLLGK